MTVVFSVAEDHIPQIQQQLAARAGLRVDLYDRSQTRQIATGRLLSLDNQVDTTTGTVRLRAQFSNAQNQLFPNQFVNARLQVDTLRGARILPTVAVQYNGQQAFVYRTRADGTVALQNIRVVNANQDETAVEGLELGDSVVTSNFDRLQDGARVLVPAARTAARTAPAGPAQ
jgi:multidrug efflux system membrane fusion protein